MMTINVAHHSLVGVDPPTWAALACLLLTYAASSLNPFIYTIYSDTFRTRIRALMYIDMSSSAMTGQLEVSTGGG